MDLGGRLDEPAGSVCRDCEDFVGGLGRKLFREIRWIAEDCRREFGSILSMLEHRRGPRIAACFLHFLRIFHHETTLPGNGGVSPERG